MYKNLISQKFGLWTVIDYAGSRKNSENKNVRYWKCKCDCGTVRDVLEQSLKQGLSKSCGCVRSMKIAEVGRTMGVKHGMTNTRLYRIYKHMRNRCYREKDIRYPEYGGRGITVCDEWMYFEPFAEWALSNGYSDSLTLDRIDVNGNYSPDNCRWADIITQASNKRNVKIYEYNNEKHTIAEWARIYDMNYKKLWKRLTNGWDIEKALTT